MINEKNLHNQYRGCIECTNKGKERKRGNLCNLCYLISLCAKLIFVERDVNSMTNNELTRKIISLFYRVVENIRAIHME